MQITNNLSMEYNNKMYIKFDTAQGKVDVWWELLVPLIQLLDCLLSMFFGKYPFCKNLHYIINVWINNIPFVNKYVCIECESRFSCGWMDKVLFCLIYRG